MLADVLTAKEPVTTYTGFAMVTKCDVRQDRRGNSYLAVTFADRTSSMEARYWDNAVPVDLGSRMKIRCEVNEYNNELQLKVLQWRPAVVEDAVDDGHYIRTTQRDREAMWSFVRDQQYTDWNLGSLVNHLLDVHRYGVLNAPAAKGNHQPYIGGLLEHIENLIRLVDGVMVVYPTLDRDVLVAACIIHDLGKVEELAWEPAISYTRSGQLLGHIVIGIKMLAAASKDFPLSPKIAHLEHLLISHHGRQEWGSPVEPMSREACVFHQLDMIDSRMGFFDELKFNGSEFLFHKGQNYWRGCDATS